MRVADLLIDTLANFNVDYVFGIPGDAINPVVDAIAQKGKPVFIVVRNEESGALMASAYGKLSGKLSACLGTAGPGSIHLLNGLYDAKLDRSPVVAITGQVETSKIGTGYSQEVNLYSLFNDVAIFNHVVTTAENVGSIFSLACKTALIKKGVAHLNIPIDVSQKEVKDVNEVKSYYREHSIPVNEESIREAIDVLNAGKKVAILVGRGALGCEDKVEEIAQKLLAPVLITYPAKGIFPDTSPFNMGILSPLAPRTYMLMKEADTILIIGADYPYAELIPHNASIVQIDINQENIGKRFNVKIGLLGEASRILDKLVRGLKENKDGSFLKQAQKEKEELKSRIEARALQKEKPLNPYYIVKTLEMNLEEDAIISLDSGAVTIFTVSAFNAKRHRFVVSGRLGTMGFGLPATIASKLAFPERRCVSIVGDGGFAMTMAEFMTAVKYKLPIMVVVFNNGKLALIKFEQMLLGYREFATELGSYDFAKYAEACGGLGIKVEEPGQLEDAINRCMSFKGPSLIDINTNPNEVPIVS